MVFLGNFRHPPNVDSLAYLCNVIVPKLEPSVLAAHPISIVGNALEEQIRELGRGLASVAMVGWVPDVAPYLGRARITLVPLRYGAGTKRKLIQALMMGTPTVTSSVGAEGLELVDGEHVLIADDPARFAAACERLLRDAELWQRLAEQGRAHILAPRGRPAARERLRGAVAALLPPLAARK